MGRNRSNASREVMTRRVAIPYSSECIGSGSAFKR